MPVDLDALYQPSQSGEWKPAPEPAPPAPPPRAVGAYEGVERLGGSGALGLVGGALNAASDVPMMMGLRGVGEAMRRGAASLADVQQQLAIKPNEQLTTAGQVAGTVAGVAPDLMAIGATAFTAPWALPATVAALASARGSERFQSLVSQGVDQTEAGRQALITAGTVAVGYGVPASLPGGAAFRTMTGGGLNLAVDEAGRAVSNQSFDAAGYPQHVQGFDPVNAAISFGIGGLIGGVAGGRGAPHATRGRAPSIDRELFTPPQQEPAAPPPPPAQFDQADSMRALIADITPAPRVEGAPPTFVDLANGGFPERPRSPALNQAYSPIPADLLGGRPEPYTMQPITPAIRQGFDVPQLAPEAPVPYRPIELLGGQPRPDAQLILPGQAAPGRSVELANRRTTYDVYLDAVRRDRAGELLSPFEQQLLRNPPEPPRADVQVQVPRRSLPGDAFELRGYTEGDLARLEQARQQAEAAGEPAPTSLMHARPELTLEAPPTDMLRTRQGAVTRTRVAPEQLDLNLPQPEAPRVGMDTPRLPGIESDAAVAARGGDLSQANLRATLEEVANGMRLFRKDGEPLRKWLSDILGSPDPLTAIRRVAGNGTHNQAELLNRWHEALTGKSIEAADMAAPIEPPAAKPAEVAPVKPAEPPAEVRAAAETAAKADADARKAEKLVEQLPVDDVRYEKAAADARFLRAKANRLLGAANDAMAQAWPFKHEPTPAPASAEALQKLIDTWTERPLSRPPENPEQLPLPAEIIASARELKKVEELADKLRGDLEALLEKSPKSPRARKLREQLKAAEDAAAELRDRGARMVAQHDRQARQARGDSLFEAPPVPPEAHPPVTSFADYPTEPRARYIALRNRMSQLVREGKLPVEELEDIPAKRVTAAKAREYIPSMENAIRLGEMSRGTDLSPTQIHERIEDAIHEGYIASGRPRELVAKLKAGTIAPHEMALLRAYLATAETSAALRAETAPRKVDFSLKKGFDEAHADLEPGADVVDPAVARLRDNVRQQLGRPVGILPARAVDGANPARVVALKLAQVLGRIFRRNVVLVKGVGGKSLPFDGAHDGGTIFIDVNAKNPVMQVFGHEVYHNIELRNPEAAEAFHRALVGAEGRQGVDDGAADMYWRYDRAGVPLEGDVAFSTKRVTQKLVTEGREYEGRLWGGAYSHDRLRTAAKDAPIHRMIQQARQRYNAIRAELGLAEVKDWTTRPEQLVQDLRRPDIRFSMKHEGPTPAGMRAAEREFTADAFGDMLRKPEFWQRVAKNSPDLVGTIAAWVMRYGTRAVRTLEQLRGRGHDVLAADLPNLAAVRDAAADAFVAYSKTDHLETSPRRTDFLISRGDSLRAVEEAVNAGVSQMQMPREMRAVLDANFGKLASVLPLRKLVRSFGDYLPALRAYEDAVFERQTTIKLRMEDAQKLTSALREADNRDALSSVMLRSTSYQMFPYKTFNEQGWLANTPEARAQYAELTRDWNQLSEKDRALYEKARVALEESWKRVKDALREQIGRLEGLDPEKRAQFQRDLDAHFGKLQGPYFPLSRFGRHVVIAREKANPQNYSVEFFESAREALKAADELRADGKWAVGQTVRNTDDYTRLLEGVPTKFVGELNKAIRASGDALSGEQKNFMLDAVMDVYVRSLPAQSGTKSFLKRARGGVKGYSADAFRGVANGLVRGGYLEATLNTRDKIQRAILDGEAQTKALRDNEADASRAQELTSEMKKRYDLLLRQVDTPVVDAATGVAYAMNLALSPAYMILNLSQTPMMAMPYLAARYGGDAVNELVAAARDAATRTNWHWDATTTIDFDALARTPEEANMLRSMAGLMADTQTIELTSVREAQGHARELFSKILSFGSHHVELFNRATTALAAYRLEMKKSNDHVRAVDAAEMALDETQFDYSRENRARVLQHPFGRIALQFQNYSFHMLYSLARNIRQAGWAKDPEVRRTALATVAGQVGMAALMGGALALPGMDQWLTLADMLSWMAGDDEEPNARVKLTKVLGDAVGQDAARLITRGVVGALGADISGRVGFGSLVPFMRYDPSDAQGSEWLYKKAFQAFGPAGGVADSITTGVDLLSQGKYRKGVEALAPKVLRDTLKAHREASEGVTNRAGETMVPADRVTAAMVMAQTLGFNPAQLAELQQAQQAVTVIERRMQAEKTRLLSELYQAQQASDQRAYEQAYAELTDFNREHPLFAAQGRDVRSALRQRQQRQGARDTNAGIYVSPRRQQLLDAVRPSGD